MKAHLLKLVKNPVVVLIRGLAWTLVSQEAMRYATATIKVLKKKISDSSKQ